MILPCCEHNYLPYVLSIAATCKIKCNQRILCYVKQPRWQAIMLHFNQILQVGLTVGKILRTSDKQLLIHYTFIREPALLSLYSGNKGIVKQ